MSSDTSLVFNLIAKDKASAALDSMKEKLTTASSGIAMGVAAALGKGVADSLDMTASSNKLAAQLALGPAKAAQVNKVAANVFKAGWGESFDDVNGAIKSVVQNIGDVGHASGGLEGVSTKVLAVSKTFDQDLGATTAAVGQLMRTGLAKNADEALDIVTKGLQSGANKADDLLETFNEYAPQFQKIGMSGNDALNGINQLVRAGAKDSDAAADAFKEFGLRAIDTADSTTDAYKGLHLNADKTRSAIAGGGPTASKAMQQVFDALQKVKDPVKQNALGTALMGGQWEDTVRAILPKIDLTKNRIGTIKGATDRVAKTMAESPTAAMERFKRGVTMKLAEVGGAFVTWAMKHQTYMKPIGIGLAGIAATILVVRGAMMAWTAMQAIWTGVVGIATAAQWLWNAALAANPIGLVVLAIIAVIVIIVVLWKRSTTFRHVVTAAWQAVWSKIRDVWSWISTKLWPGIKSAWSKISNGAADMWNAVSGWFGRVYRFVTGLPGRLRRGVGNLGKLLWNKGKDVVRGLWNGISGMGDWIYGKILTWVRNVIPKPIWDVMQFGSPSKLTTKYGKWVGQGLVKGLIGTESQVKAASKKLAGIVREAFKPGKKRTALLDMVSSDTKQLLVLAARQKTVAQHLKDAQAKLLDLRKSRKDLIGSIRDGIVGATDITATDEGTKITADSILKKLMDGVGKAKAFAANLITLRKKGLRSSMIDEIAQKGVEGGAESAAALAAATAGQIQGINTQRDALTKAGTAAGTAAAGAMYDSGIKAAQGLVAGLQKEEKSIGAQMLRIAKLMQRAIKKALGIKSPSQLMAGIGRFVPPGVMLGVRQASPKLEADLSKWAAEAIPGATRGGAGSVPVAAARPLARGGVGYMLVDVHVYDDEGKLKKTIRKMVRVDGRGDVQTAFGKKPGQG